MKLSAPLLAERLPLYATDPELRAAIFGARAKDPACGGMYDKLTKLPNFPKMRSAMGGRHVPSVLAWFDSYENGVVERRLQRRSQMHRLRAGGQRERRVRRPRNGSPPWIRVRVACSNDR